MRPYFFFRNPLYPPAQKALRLVLRTLRSRYPTHPTSLPTVSSRLPKPYPCGRYRNRALLCGFAAYIETYDRPPDAPDRRPGAYKSVLDPFYRFQSECVQFPHLIMHSDSKGFYMPTDFAHPLLKVSKTPWLPRLGWRWFSVGSAVALLRELEILRPLIGITSTPDPWDTVALDHAISSTRFDIEVKSWIEHHWAASVTVDLGCILELT